MQPENILKPKVCLTLLFPVLNQMNPHSPIIILEDTEENVLNALVRFTRIHITHYNIFVIYFLLPIFDEEYLGYTIKEENSSAVQ